MNESKTWRKAFFPKGFEGSQMSRDLRISVDDDGKAYYIHAAEENHTVHISELTDDYLDFAGKWMVMEPVDHNEAPAIFKYQEKYYLIASCINEPIIFNDCNFMKIPILFVFLLINITAYSQDLSYQPDTADPKVPEGYELVWNEEFDMDGKPDSSSWSYEQGFVRNNELQWYQPDNASIKDGLLVIEGRREKIKNTSYDQNSKDWRNYRAYAEYSSSSIHTRGKHSFQYGIFEIRAKIDPSSGMWPAIWTLGVTKGWPANGEIDIMEYYQVKGEPTILANAAWAHERLRAAWDEVKIPFSAFLEKDPEWADKFHIWKMEWDEAFIRIYLDDELLNEVDLSQTLNPDGYNPFHQPHYILLNLAIGSNGGDPSSTDFPKTYQVDYVRVFQKMKNN